LAKSLHGRSLKKGALNLARQNDHIPLSKATKHDIEAVQLRLDRISEKLVQVQLNVADEKSRRLLRAPDPSLNYNKAQGDRHPEIGAWFTASEAFEIWKTGPKPFLGLYGILGCGTSLSEGYPISLKGAMSYMIQFRNAKFGLIIGKTILSSTVLENILCYPDTRKNSAVLYFFFDFNDAGKQRHEN